MEGSHELNVRLAAHQELVPIAPGLHLQGRSFTSVVGAVASLLRRQWCATTDLTMRVPPVLPISTAVRTGYPVAFPQLLVVGKGFDGGHDDYRDVVRRIGQGASWADRFDETAVVLTPAACHGVYAVVPKQLPGDGLRIEASATCCRNEATFEPGRLLSFEMLELVQLGAPATVASFVGWCLGWAPALLKDLGLDVTVGPASDPFFLGDRARRLLTGAAQKHELSVQLTPEAPERVAVASVNDHGRHFTQAFDIGMDDAPASSGCVGFGLERLALALHGRYGPEVAAWPTDVRLRLELVEAV